MSRLGRNSIAAFLKDALALTITFSLTFGCATTENSDSELSQANSELGSAEQSAIGSDQGAAQKPVPKPSRKSHYTITIGKPVKNQAPLPNQVPAYITVHFADGTSKEYLGGRGWDFDKDGRMDMVEVVDEQGHDRAYVFDFDADGKPDFVRVKSEPRTEDPKDVWQDEIIADVERDRIRMDKDGKPIASGDDGVSASLGDEQPDEPKSFSGLDLGLELISTKLAATDNATSAKATFFSKSHLGLGATYSYYTSRDFAYRLTGRLRSLQFDKDDSGAMKAQDLLLMGAGGGIGYRIAEPLVLNLLVGYEQQPFLHSKDAASVAFEIVGSPTVRLDAVWDLFEWSLYGVGVIGAAEYSLGGKNGDVTAEADLGYQGSVYLQRQFGSFVSILQVDWRSLNLNSEDVKQTQTDLGMQLQFSMMLGEGAK